MMPDRMENKTMEIFQIKGEVELDQVLNKSFTARKI